MDPFLNDLALNWNCSLQEVKDRLAVFTEVFAYHFIVDCEVRIKNLGIFHREKDCMRKFTDFRTMQTSEVPNFRISFRPSSKLKDQIKAAAKSFVE